MDGNWIDKKIGACALVRNYTPFRELPFLESLQRLAELRLGDNWRYQILNQT